MQNSEPHTAINKLTSCSGAITLLAKNEFLAAKIPNQNTAINKFVIIIAAVKTY